MLGPDVIGSGSAVAARAGARLYYALVVLHKRDIYTLYPLLRAR